MGAIVNGLAAYGGFYPYGSTFLNFLGYMLGMHIGVVHHRVDAVDGELRIMSGHLAQQSLRLTLVIVDVSDVRMQEV
jgi:hypothetical protein